MAPVSFVAAVDAVVNGWSDVVRIAEDGPPSDDVWRAPVSDRGALGVGLGMALAGSRVVVQASSSARLPALLEVLAEAGRVHASGQFAVPLIVRMPFGTEAAGLDRELGSLAAGLEGVTVLAPSCAGSAAGLMESAGALGGPVLFLESRGLAGARGEPQKASVSARVVREGKHVTLAAFGSGVGAAQEAAERLADSGVSAEVLDLAVLQPLDREALASSVRRTGRLVVVHDGEPTLASMVRTAALDGAFLYLEAPFVESASSPGSVAAAATRSVTY